MSRIELRIPCALSVALLALCGSWMFAQQTSRTDPASGSISGKLLDRDGKPAANIRVTAVAVEDTARINGAAVPAGSSMLSLTQSDSTGSYRLENVPPGRYYISAGFVDVPTYYPGVASQAQATVVAVAPQGTINGIDFRMVIPSGLRFAGKVVYQDSTGTLAGTPPAPQAGGRGGIPLQNQVRMIGSGAASQGMQTATVSADGSFEFSNLKPGNYQLMPPPGVRAPNTTVTLTEKDITNYQLVVPLMVAVSISTSVEGGGLIPRIPITFASAAGASNGINGLMVPGASFNFTLATGEYRVSAGALPAGYTLKSIKSGDLDLAKESLKITGGGVPPVQFILGVAMPPPWVRMSGRITGRALSNSVLFSVTSQNLAEALNPILYLDGSFEIPRVLPGDYSIRTIGSSGANQQQNNMLSSTIRVGSADVADAVIQVPENSDPLASNPMASGMTTSTRVSGHIAGRAKATPGAKIRLSRSDTPETMDASIFMDGTFEFPRVPPGSWTAEVIPAIAGALPKTIFVAAADISGIEIAVPATREVSGRVEIENGGSMPQVLTISSGSMDEIPIPLQPDGYFQLVVADGQNFRVPDGSLPQGYSLQLLKYGAQDLIAAPIHFTNSNSDELRVMLRASLSTVPLRGRISGLLPELMGSHVWLTSSNVRSLETGIAADGAFEFAKVSPGTYIVQLAGSGIPASSSSTLIQVAGAPISDILIAAPRIVSGRVIVDGSGAMPSFSIPLTRGSVNGAPVETTATIQPAQDGTFRVALPVGEHRAAPAVGLPAGYSIQSIHYGTATDLLRDSLNVSAGDSSELIIHVSPGSPK